jgi:lipopolysaccharide transport system ATP-binding protein
LEEVCVFNIASYSEPRPVGLIRTTVQIPGDFLNMGSYYVKFLLVQDECRAMFWHQNALSFEVADRPRAGRWFGRVPGVVRPRFAWKTEMLPPEADPLQKASA